MSRYRKIEVRTWSDQKFRDLSGIPPSGQGLWFFLLTGPHTGPIPGLFRAGRASMAEELNWDIEAFDEAFQEVFDQGMAKADFKSRLVWLPNAIRHNKPESPNVVRGWRVELDLLPECALKSEAIAAIRNALSETGPSFVAAFDELIAVEDAACEQPSAKPSRKPSDKPSIVASAKVHSKPMPNQEQEQEQEQEQIEVNTPVAQNRRDQTVSQIFEYWKKVMDSPKSKLDANRKGLISNALKIYSASDICRAIRGCSKTPHNMGKNDRNTKFNGLDLILRNAEKVDYFIGLDGKQARLSTHESFDAANARAMAEFLGNAPVDAEESRTINMEATT